MLWEGLAELRADAPSKARGAEGERGRPPPSSNTQCPITPRTRQTRPTKKATFPRNKAEKLPYQQHDLPILTVGPNQLKYRLSRTNTPKSYPSSNTQCPITLAFPAPASRKVATKPTRFVHPSSWLPPTKIPTFRHQKAKKSPFQQHVVSYNPEGERGRPPPSSNTQRPITPRTRQTRPTKIVTFPRDKAEKSPC